MLDYLNEVVTSDQGYGRQPDTIPTSGMPPVGDITPNQQPFQGTPPVSGTPNQMPPQATPAPQPQTDGREAYFQSRYDQITSYLKNNGVEIGEDPAKSLEQLVSAYNALNTYSQNPETLLRKVKEIYPDYVKEPDGSLWIQQRLDQEFGPDFIANDRDALVVGSETWKYNFRMNQLMNEYNFNDLRQKDAAARQQEYQTQQQEQYFVQQKQSAMQKFNLNEQTMEGVLTKLKDPGFWTFENVVKFALSEANTAQTMAMPPSLGNVPGSSAPMTNSIFAEFLGR